MTTFYLLLQVFVNFENVFIVCVALATQGADLGHHTVYFFPFTKGTVQEDFKSKLLQKLSILANMASPADSRKD